MGNDGVNCALSQGNFPLLRDFWPFFQNCQVEYAYTGKTLQIIDLQSFMFDFVTSAGLEPATLRAEI